MKSDTLDVGAIQAMQRSFVQERDWTKYHTPKNLSIALSVEASELAEIFQWLTDAEALEAGKVKKREAVEDEVADILYYLLRFADVLDIDLTKALLHKMKKNADKYPVELAKGNARKYTELRDGT